MLVLSRKVGETITIGDAVQLTVVAISNNKVCLGITAPLDIPVYQAELKATSDWPETASLRGNIDHAKTD